VGKNSTTWNGHRVHSVPLGSGALLRMWTVRWRTSFLRVTTRSPSVECGDSTIWRVSTRFSISGAITQALDAVTSIAVLATASSSDEGSAPVTAVPLVRSFLYVPGDRGDRVVKAFEAEADAVLIDLEDSVALSAKEVARNEAVEILRRQSPSGPAVWVRINSGELGRRDVAALATKAVCLAGIVLAKCDDPSWLDEIGTSMPLSVQLAPLIESALGLRRLDTLCAHPRVTQCHLGEIDLLSDVGAHDDVASQLLGHARAQLLYASAAAGIYPPIGGGIWSVPRPRWVRSRLSPSGKAWLCWTAGAAPFPGAGHQHSVPAIPR
jgi:hypothetical protein